MNPGEKNRRSLFRLKRLHLSIRWDRAALFALLAGSLGLSLWQFNWLQVGSFMDDAEYIVLAKSIVVGPTYGLINPPNEVFPTRYPFGWPLILALVYALFGGNFQALKIVSLLFTLANTVLIWTNWKYLGIPGRLMGIATATLFGLSPMAILQASELMSEPAFTFFVLLGLILTVKATDDSNIVQSFALGTVWMFVAYVRLIGLGLVVISMLYLVLKKRWMKLLLATASLMLALLMVVTFTPIKWHDLVNVGIYHDQFDNPSKWGQFNVAEDTITRGGQGLFEYLAIHLRDSLIPFIGAPKLQQMLWQVNLGFLPVLVSALVLGLIVTGSFVSIQSTGILPVYFFIPLSMAILILWPYRGTRFLYPILPFLFAYLLIGGLAVLGTLSKRISLGKKKYVWSSVLGFGALVLLLCAQLGVIVRRDNSLNHVRDLSVGTTWIKQNAVADAVVVAEQPQAVYLYSGRPTVDLTNDVSALEEIARQKTVYLLIAPELKWSDDGILEYSRETQKLLNALDSSVLPTELVFEDKLAMVKVFLLKQADMINSLDSNGNSP